jgi:ribosome-binding factor A
MAGRRLERLNEQLKREITDLLRTEVRDPRVGVVTLTDVAASRDLSYARIHVTALDAADRKEEVLEGLRAASAFLRGELGRRLHVRRVPELDFRWDDTLDYAKRIEQLLRENLPRTPTQEDTGDGGELPPEAADEASASNTSEGSPDDPLEYGGGA